MSGCHVRTCPNMSKLNFRGHMIRAWNELVLKRDKNEILKFWKSEVGFELKSLTLIEKDIISLIILMLDERRGLAVIHFAHNFDENKILNSTFLAQWSLYHQFNSRLGSNLNRTVNGQRRWSQSRLVLIWGFGPYAYENTLKTYFLMVCYILPIPLVISSNKTMILKVS